MKQVTMAVTVRVGDGADDMDLISEVAEVLDRHGYQRVTVERDGKTVLRYNNPVDEELWANPWPTLR